MTVLPEIVFASLKQTAVLIRRQDVGEATSGAPSTPAHSKGPPSNPDESFVNRAIKKPPVWDELGLKCLMCCSEGEKGSGFASG